jgi:hypothetical protein
MQYAYLQIDFYDIMPLEQSRVMLNNMPIMKIQLSNIIPKIRKISGISLKAKVHCRKCFQI